MSNPIYTANMRILNATSFLQNVSRTSPTADSLYAFIAKTTAWDANETVVDPVDILSSELVTRSDMVAMKRIYANNIAYVVPRYNWTSGIVYTQYSTTVAKTTLFSSNFYVITSDNYVYKCISNNSGAQSTVQPTGTSTTNIILADGYVWKFMFDISTTMVTNFLTTNWIPVPVGSQKSTLQIAVETTASYSAGQPIGGHGSNAYLELGAYRLMFYFTFDGIESNKFPTNISYRKVGIMLNPLTTGGAVASASVYEADTTGSTEINVNTGSMIYVEHKSPIVRSSSQKEEYKIVVEF